MPERRSELGISLFPSFFGWTIWPPLHFSHPFVRRNEHSSTQPDLWRMKELHPPRPRNSISANYKMMYCSALTRSWITLRKKKDGFNPSCSSQVTRRVEATVLLLQDTVTTVKESVSFAQCNTVFERLPVSLSLLHKAVSILLASDTAEHPPTGCRKSIIPWLLSKR